MIIRKPYAFLIKHFRLIHGLLFVMLVYLSIKSLSIYTFFNEYATKHYFTNIPTLASDHITTLMYIVAILVTLVCAVVYYLLAVKKKSRGIYLIIGIYSLVLFFYFIYIYNVLFGLTTKTLNIETVRAIRDIAIIVVLPQIVFIFIILSRCLGFNLKKFEFKKDLEDLQIETTDNEEVEVTLGKNNYKYKRFIVKTIRHMGYFIQENKFFVTALLSILMFSISIYIYMNIKVYNVKYETNQVIFANTLWYKVNASYTTNKDVSGKVINSKKTYVIVNVNIDNKSNRKYSLSRELFRLDIGSQAILPKFNIDKEFKDFGKAYAPMVIDAGSEENYNVIFELDESSSKNEYLFKISNIENVNASAAKEQYKDVIIRPKNIDEVVEGSNYRLFDNISFDGTILNNTKLKITDYSVAKSFKDKYLFCLNDNCYDKTYLIKPSDNDKNSILKIVSEYEIDPEINIKKELKDSSELFNYFGNIKYRYLGITYEEKLKKANVTMVTDGVAYFEVPQDVINANKIEIILTIRGKIITIILK